MARLKITFLLIKSVVHTVWISNDNDRHS